MRCSDHCPPEATGGIVVAAAAVGTTVASGVAAVAGDILLAAGIVLAVLIVAGVTTLVVVLRRNPGAYFPGGLPERRGLPAGQRASVTAAVRPAIEAARTVPGVVLGEVPLEQSRPRD